MKGLDWGTLTDKAQQRIRQADHLGEMIAAISALLYQLNDSHTVFIPPGRTQRATYGFEARPFGNDILISELDKDGPAAKAGLRLGDKVIGVDNFDVNPRQLFRHDALRHFSESYFLNPTMEMDLDVVRATGASEAIKIPTKLESRWARMQFNTWTYNDTRRGVDAQEPFYSCKKYGKTAYIKLRTFAVPREEVAPMINKARNSGALIIDLRGNPVRSC
jgi:C-terminal processing protease CtpA/Prc